VDIIATSVYGILNNFMKSRNLTEEIVTERCPDGEVEFCQTTVDNAAQCGID